MVEQDISRVLFPYNRVLISELSIEQGGLVRIGVDIPPSVTCLGLPHASPTDVTLALMQVGYAVTAASIPNLPPNFQYDALFLGHSIRYEQQEVGSVEINCRIKSRSLKEVNIATLDLQSLGVFRARLMCGIPTQAPIPLLDSLEAKGEKVSVDRIAEILDIYNGELQSDVVEMGYDSVSHAYEVAIRFLPYSEMRGLTHVSARQMTEALMKTAYCVAGHQAFLGNLPLTYEEFLERRLDFLTRYQDIMYRKLLVAGSVSLARCHIQIQGDACKVIFTHRPRAISDQKSFATGEMEFYLPA